MDELANIIATVLQSVIRLLQDVVNPLDGFIATVLGVLWFIKVASNALIVRNETKDEKDKGFALFWSLIDDFIVYFAVGLIVVSLRDAAVPLPYIVAAFFLYIGSIVLYLRLIKGAGWADKLNDDLIAVILLTAYALVSSETLTAEMLREALEFIYQRP